MQLDIVTNEINLVLEELFDFIQKGSIIKDDFEEYIKTMGGKNYYKNNFTDIAIPYIFERTLPKLECSVIEFYLKNHSTLPEEAKNLLNSLKNSISSVFEIKKNIKNGFELLNLVNEKTYQVIYPFKMTNLRGIGVGQYIVARLFNFEKEYYFIEISGVLPSNKKEEALQYAVAKIIQEPFLVYLDNKVKEKELEKNVKNMHSKFIEAFGSNKIFTTSTFSDDIISMFNEFSENNTPIDLEGKIQEPDEYKYFEVKDYNTNYNTFIENSVTGYFNKKEVYDVAIIFDNKEGLYVVPFYKSLERILTSDKFDEVENYEKCIQYFLTSPSVSAKILTELYETHPRFLDIINYVLKDNLTFQEILDKYKKTNYKVFSHTTILYNSEVFSKTLNNIVDNKKREEIDYSKVKRNDPCPCGSGKKYKHCCMV